MRVLTNPTPAILNHIRTFVKKNKKVVPIKLVDGRWAIPDSVLSDPDYAEWYDEILSRTTFVPDFSVTPDPGWTQPVFEPLPQPAPQPPPVRPT